MAAAAKKLSFPNTPCPKCKAPIHIRSQKHEKCGWVMKKTSAPAAKAAPAAKKKLGRPAGKKMGRPAGASKNGGGISIQDIEAVKSLTDKIGAAKVKELAEVLA